ncbi:MAG: Wzz/FepE/Etk N-terminal domain-containing protein [Candidatus Omnitrophica bacterium]|nr:Wzz/FepE/Etk N-terminal domain-containing protein [Candidatus Omnitrophota bacterium]
MTLRDYAGVLFRRKWVIIAAVITMTATVIIGLLLKTPVYEAQVMMLISGRKQAQAEYYTDIPVWSGRSSQIALTQSEIVTSDPVIERAVSVLGLAKLPLDYENKFASRLKKPVVELRARRFEKKLKDLDAEQRKAFMFRLAIENLKRRMKVTPIRDTNLFLIKVRDYSPVAAAVTANVVSRSYTIFDLEQQVAEMKLKYGEKNQSVIELQEAIKKMARGLNGKRLAPQDAIGPATVKIIEQAKVPIKPAGISRFLTAGLASFMSIFLGVILAFAFEYMDQTVKSPRDAESFLGIDYLGSLRRRAKPGDYRNLSEQLYFALQDKGARLLTVASSAPREGVVPIVAQLGSYIAQNARKRVLLIDLNFKNPLLHKMFKLPEGKNVMNVIEGILPFEQGVKSVGNNLDVLTSGPSVAQNGRIFESHMMKDLFNKARELYDMVLITAVPMRDAKDTAILASITDGLVVVLNERKTRRHVAKAAVERLTTRGVQVLGFVLNNRTFAIPGFIYNRL